MTLAPPAPPSASPPLPTGLDKCFDSSGNMMDCASSGQDAQFARPSLDSQRFTAQGDLVRDRLTGLMWPKNANPFDFPLPWEEALASVARWNKDKVLGRSDWRLPNRRELRSLVSHGASKPALPPGHPFDRVFQGWYWTSTTAAIAPAYAWYVHLAGGRMFYGAKDREYMVWPVAGLSSILPRTGQRRCFDVLGREVPCAGTGQDGELRLGAAWPEERFQAQENLALDRLTGLTWLRDADLAKGLVSWDRALEMIAGLEPGPAGPWRLPNINELESLVDASESAPALPQGHPFTGVGDAAWSSSSSGFEPDWAFALYLTKGAVGVGFKPKQEFTCMAVSGQAKP